LIQRVALILVTLFWITMNVLLWRAEYASRGESRSPVPPRLVWRKILTAPDSSSLGIFHHGKKIGFCHWSTTVGQELGKTTEEDSVDEGRVSKVAGYRLQLEGNVSIPESSIRGRFDGSLGLGGDESWRDLTLRLSLKPALWEIRSIAAEKTVRVRIEEDNSRFERTFQFDEFRNPASLFADFAGPAGMALLRLLGSIQGPGMSVKAPIINPKWDARQDSVTISHSAIRAYRLSTRLLEKYDVVIFASRAGEILRVELPDEVLLVNDQFATP
jgi:hypothetical protein